MLKHTGLMILLCMLTLGISNISAAADDQVYGWQLMSEQERAEHRTKMQSMKTEEERERYRIEHHKKMQERAAKRGVDLPDEPLRRGGSMNNGMGSGMGQGKGGNR